MAPLRFMASGPWGHEPVPTCSTAAAVEIASTLFGRIMAGEIDILGCTGVDGAPGLPALTDVNRDSYIEGSAAAWRMVQARARRHVDLPVSGEREMVLAAVARTYLGFGSLAEHCGDDRDFCEVGRGSVKAALDAAYAAGQAAARPRVPERAPDAATARAAQIAGVIASAVMAGEMSLGQDFTPDAVEVRIPGPKIGPEFGADLLEGFRITGLMISARARASVRTPSHAALSAAEAALALAEDALDHFAPREAAPQDVDDFHAAMGAIADTLRAGLDPLHAAEKSDRDGSAVSDLGLRDIPFGMSPYEIVRPRS